MKKVLILGASSDIGFSLTKKYLNRNYYVYAHYNKNVGKLRKLKRKI